MYMYVKKRMVSFLSILRPQTLEYEPIVFFDACTSLMHGKEISILSWSSKMQNS